jgi:hypothetical protein
MRADDGRAAVIAAISRCTYIGMVFLLAKSGFPPQRLMLTRQQPDWRRRRGLADPQR